MQIDFDLLKQVHLPSLNAPQTRFRCVASFRNESDTNVTAVDNKDRISDFVMLVKLR